MYTIDYFIEKFEKIPESQWAVFTQQTSGGERCALGHCITPSFRKKLDISMVPSAHFGHNTAEGIALCELFKTLNNKSPDKPEYYAIVTRINNGMDDRYKQKSPRSRILAALRDIRVMQQPKYKDITKELAVFPVDEAADIPVKELV